MPVWCGLKVSWRAGKRNQREGSEDIRVRKLKIGIN